MRIMLAALHWDYGDWHYGPSYEYMNLWQGLPGRKGMPEPDTFFFPLEQRWDLATHAREHKPELILWVPFEILPRGIEAARQYAKIVAWNCDDHQRLDYVEKHVLPYVDACVTTWPPAVDWYREKGMPIHLSQWAFDPLYRHDLYYDEWWTSDVAFVGQCYGNRPQIVEAIKQAGIDIKVYGRYWPDAPYLTNPVDMYRVFASARINLCLTTNARGLPVRNVKGRHFEVPGCGGCLLTEPAMDLEKYFVNSSSDEPGEIVIAQPELLIDALRYYLDHPDERDRIARAGYNRVCRDHSWAHRFETLFEFMKSL